MKSIRRDLSIALLAGVLSLFGIISLAFYFYVRSSVVSQFDDSLRSRARALLTLVEIEKGGLIGFELDDRQLPEFSRRRAPDYFELWQEPSNVLRRSPSLGDRDLERLTGTYDKPMIRDLTLPDGRPGRAVGVRFRPRVEIDASAGAPSDRAAPIAAHAELVIAADRRPLDRTLARIRRGLLAGLILTPLGATLLVLALVRRGLGPVRKLADETRNIDAESLDRRFSAADLPAELHPIAVQMNSLLDRLQTAFARERRFNADVAHELRTPVAELRSASEVAIKWPDDKDTAGHLPETALQIAVQMESLVEGLLQLARCQSGRLSLHLETADLAEIIRSSWASFERKATERGLRAEVHAPRGVALRTDRAILGAILSNLFTNAIDYTPTGGSMDVRAGERGGEIEIIVSNSGVALTSADLPSLTEPFWRKDSARTDGTHAGLGLALASEYVRLLGGRLALNVDSASTFHASITLPAARGESRQA